MVVGALVLGATGAFFSDNETSVGNTFTTGAIDLKVDSDCSYNGETQSGQCGNWTLKDLEPTSDKFFNFNDIKPGDEGENTISLHVFNNDAWLCAEVSNLTDYENSQTEPEASVDFTVGSNQGELSQTMEWIVWRDDGAGGGVVGDNVQNGTEQTLASGNPTNGVLPLYDSTTATGPLLAGTTGYLGVAWSLPSASGNETQTDSMIGNISFHVEQARNNTNFTCASVAPSEDGEGSEDNGSALGPALGPMSVNLLSADNFVLLSQTGITDANPSVITGNVGSYPISGTATLVTCSEVTGIIYSTDAAGPLPCRVTNGPLLNTAVNDVTTAYGDAAGRTLPTATELGAGDIGGMTLAPGLYKWSTGVTIPTDVILSGDANDVWIFQISGDLSIASAKEVKLIGGALAKNVFWQVGGPTGATLGTYSTFRGTILSSKQVILQSGAVLYGRAMAQTQVTLDANTVTLP